MILKNNGNSVVHSSTAKISDLFMEIVGAESNAVIEIYLRPTLVAMVTKIGNFSAKFAKTWLIQEI